jgi:ubiquinone/menaquinone biosynthesis C-methylase UbiE
VSEKSIIKIKGNLKDNWSKSYESLDTTYETKDISTRVDLCQKLGYEFVLENIQKRINTSNSYKTLEIGCGGARVSVYLAQKGANVTVADYSKEALRLARANFKKSGIQGTFVIEDACSLNFPDNSFDVTMSFGMLEHFEDIDTPIKEAVRVLRPGGVFIHSIIPKKFSLMSIANAWNFIARFVNNAAKGRFKNIIHNSRRNFPHYENDYSKKRYLESMKKAGLDECCVTGTGLWPQFHIPKGLEKVIVKYFEKNPGLLKSFDRSTSVLTDILGPEYMAIGVKKETVAQ